MTKTTKTTKQRRYQDVDLGYVFFCAARGVQRDPFGWMQEGNKDRWIKGAKAFLAELKLEAP